MPPSPQTHWILGDSSSKRFSDYSAAAVRCGMQPPRCVEWLDLIGRGCQALNCIPAGSRLRIDSFGQRDDVLAALIRHGGGNAFPKPGEIQSLDRQYSGLCRVLEDLSHWSTQRTEISLDQNPMDIAVMFDKWATHRRLLPDRPQTRLLPTEKISFGESLRRFAKQVGGRVFVKPRYASSASGVCCYRISKGRQQLIAPIEIVRDAGGIGLFNSLRVRSFTSPSDIEDIFAVLVPQGMIAEAAVNKARVEGDRFDLRVVVINGRAEHLVVRQSASPITNLHLGNRRGSLQAVTDAVGSSRVERCRRLALHAASCFPETLYCGVDILLPRSGDPLVCEVNAFGDFLPNLVAGGKTVYEAILQSNAADREALA
ncbi:STM4014 family protein [Stieleria neptunia]|nr:STM4014 family protein [Stieleria neptunia]